MLSILCLILWGGGGEKIFPLFFSIGGGRQQNFLNFSMILGWTPKFSEFCPYLVFLGGGALEYCLFWPLKGGYTICLITK